MPIKSYTHDETMLSLRQRRLPVMGKKCRKNMFKEFKHRLIKPHEVVYQALCSTGFVVSNVFEEALFNFNSILILIFALNSTYDFHFCTKKRIANTCKPVL
jgi:hypothetical protein